MSLRSANGSHGPLLLLLALVTLTFIGAGLGDRTAVPYRDGTSPQVFPENALVADGTPITIRSTSGGHIWLKDGMDAAPAEYGSEHTFPIGPDVMHASRTLAIPLAMQWRHPKPGLPAARVLRAAEMDALGRSGPNITRTFLFQDHAPLPVISIVADPGALFHPDSGIMVVGNALLHGKITGDASYTRDPRWWKYPGNFMGRGKEWERKAHLEFITAEGERAGSMPVAVRIHGQMTRGFPQHALRLIFEDPVVPWAREEHGRHATMVLRAAGNDQVKAMMRDAFQHRSCAGLPFATSPAIPCVVYINGAYWGVHHLRDRLDHEELALRHGLPAREIAILEDQAELYRGDEAAVREFRQLLHMAEQSEGKDATHMDRIQSALDVDGFLTYMASQMILGNMDWPEQNVRYWKFTGTPKEAPADGRWYFIMGDSDLSFGANAPASADPFLRVRGSQAPVARLFRALMRWPRYQAMFTERMDMLLDGPLSSESLLRHLDDMVRLMEGEMDRHTARWRKPADKARWLREVEVMRELARERGRHVREHLSRNQIPGAV